MPGKKRASGSKPTLSAKRQKSAGGASTGKRTAAGGAPTLKRDKPKSAKSIAKKDRKGKGPAFIPIPQVGDDQRKKRRRGDELDDEAGTEGGDDDEEGGESDAQSYGEEESDGMDVDEDLADVDGADFLTRLDKKGMSA